jgi:diguanylate cyclase (GGDEF)-like protein
MNFDRLETLPISRNEFSSLELFKNVQFEKLAGFLLRCSVQTVEKGGTLINPESHTRALYIVIEGTLNVNLESDNGGTFEHEITKGHCVGEMSIFDNYPPSATITAKENSRVLVIPATTTMSMLSASHELCLNFLQIMSQRLRQDNKIVCEEQYHIRCIEENAKIDPMTGLHNRRWLEEMYTREMNRSNMGNFKLTAFMIDIDHFKQVNDTYGHLAGDKVLISVAQALIRSLRPSDMPVRYGGEEFSVFLPGTTEENAKIIAERIRRNVENMTITLHDNNLLQVTVSIGFAERIENDTVASLIDRADKALYHAKQNGRNRVCQNKDNINFLIR